MKPQPTHVAYFTRKMPVEIRDRMHTLVARKRRAGVHYTVEDIVNCALEIGVTLMEFSTEREESR